jgi:hypothetical protein
VTVDTGEYVTVARADISVGWPERQPNQRYTLQTVSGETLPILKEAFLVLTLGRRPLKIWVFVANFTNEFTLGLGILLVCDAFVDLGRRPLRFAEEEVPLWSIREGPHPSSLVVANDQVISIHCEW